MASDERQCGSCGKGRGMTRQEKRYTFGPSPGINGIVELGGWEDCISPYRGSHRSEDVYVVGYGTEHERLFDTHSYRDAQEYVKSQEPRLKLFRESATRFCDAAMRELFSEAALV